jgi:hypothetical protein
MPDEASLEERVRAAIGFLRPRRPAHRRASNPADGGMRVGASPPE